MRDYIIRYYKGMHIKEIHVAAESREAARKILEQREPEHGDIVQIKTIEDNWIKEKRDFIKALEKAILTDDRSDVEYIDFIYKQTVFPKELIAITFKGGCTAYINAEINSNGANAKEIVREVYGEGAMGRIPDEYVRENIMTEEWLLAE
jgi:hypothetical protein